MTKPNVIEMHDITKKFGEFVANDHINLDVSQEKSMPSSVKMVRVSQP